jgi:hypothetical protein
LLSVPLAVIAVSLARVVVPLARVACFTSVMSSRAPGNVAVPRARVVWRVLNKICCTPTKGCYCAVDNTVDDPCKSCMLYSWQE